MDLNHEFTVHKPIEEAWKVLTDVELIAPCLPGAQLQEIHHDDGVDSYKGIVKVKLGAIQAQFKGEAHFVEKDDANHKAVLKAAGRDTGGRGNASATITALLEPVDAATTNVKVLTDLSITGKVANFGRGVLADVSDKLLAQFSDNLNSLLEGSGAETSPAEDAAAEASLADSAESAVEASAEATPTAAPEVPTDTETEGAPAKPKVRTIDGPAAEPIDLLEHAGAPLLKLLVPVLGGVVLLFLVLRRRRRRS